MADEPTHPGQGLEAGIAVQGSDRAEKIEPQGGAGQPLDYGHDGLEGGADQQDFDHQTQLRRGPDLTGGVNEDQDLGEQGEQVEQGKLRVQRH